MLQPLKDAMADAIEKLEKMPERTVQLFHHNDADGITSGAILTRAFERKGFEVRRFCLEKPYPAVLERVYEQEGKILVFADFAGRIAPLLSELNNGRNLTLILDHHIAAASTDPRVLNLDPDLFGLKGDRDISGSTTCYLFAELLDEGNRDMAHLAAIGAVADGFYVDGALVSENRDVASEAARQGRLQINKQKTGEEYLLKGPRGWLPVLEFGDYLDVLGGVGYYGDGPGTAVRACLDGVSPESDHLVDELQAVRKRIFDAEIANLRSGALHQTPHIQWFHVEERFFPMGVKMIGAFCDAIKGTDLVDPKKYIAGFQIVPDEIPGFGPIPLHQAKISMRVSPLMENEIRAGRQLGLHTFLPEATQRLGGFSDACHSLTAATTIATGKEEQLIAEMEKLLGDGQHG
jgi:single-stranded-DNA-specific exonuclease